MKTTLRQRSTAVLAAASLAFLAGCWASLGDNGGVGVGVAVPYGVDLYEPSGYEYGRWPSTYYVAPPRVYRDHDDHRVSRDRNRAQKPAFRPAPHSRPVPSLPSRPRPRPR
jgi:hypothetical protein